MSDEGEKMKWIPVIIRHSPDYACPFCGASSGTIAPSRFCGDCGHEVEPSDFCEDFIFSEADGEYKLRQPPILMNDKEEKKTI